MTDEWDLFADWWQANYRSMTQALNSQGIALSGWNEGRRQGRREAYEYSAKEMDEWAETNERLGNKEQAIAYRNAALSIRRLSSEGDG